MFFGEMGAAVAVILQNLLHCAFLAHWVTFLAWVEQLLMQWLAVEQSGHAGRWQCVQELCVIAMPKADQQHAKFNNMQSGMPCVFVVGCVGSVKRTPAQRASDRRKDT